MDWKYSKYAQRWNKFSEKVKKWWKRVWWVFWESIDRVEDDTQHSMSQKGSRKQFIPNKDHDWPSEYCQRRCEHTCIESWKGQTNNILSHGKKFPSETSNKEKLLN